MNDNERPILWAGVLIIKDRKVLVIKEIDKPFYIMPGGKLEKNESDLAAAKREVIEEIGTGVEIGDYYDEFIERSKNTNKLIRFKLYYAILKENFKDKALPKRTEDIKYINSKYKEEKIDIGNLLIKLIPKLVKQDLID